MVIVTAHMQPGVLATGLRLSVLRSMTLGLGLLIVVPPFTSLMIGTVSVLMKPAMVRFLVCLLKTVLLAEVRYL